MKDDFDFVCPTKIYFRENGVGEIGKIIHDDYRFKNTPNRILSFIKGHTNYIWTTDIQVNRRYVPCVEKYLHDHGFSTIKKGACGYEEKDVLVVSI